MRGPVESARTSVNPCCGRSPPQDKLVPEVLDLRRVDVLAAPDQHVLDAADDAAVALRVDGREVAGVHPAVDDRLARRPGVAPVALHHRVPVGQQLALNTHRGGASGGVDDLHLDMRQDASDGGDPALDAVVHVRLERDRARLGHAVGDGDLAAMHVPHHAAHQ